MAIRLLETSVATIDRIHPQISRSEKLDIAPSQAVSGFEQLAHYPLPSSKGLLQIDASIWIHVQHHRLLRQFARQILRPCLALTPH